ncbi:uncharacterized protein LOC129759379, partial [Uranotaenia lowii]|uniref:uncharacterized protein LOC129759379 n=1 Tax=Uranotaenia lowii TaxID=190385 RepID=UPI00247ABDFF
MSDLSVACNINVEDVNKINTGLLVDRNKDGTIKSLKYPNVDRFMWEPTKSIDFYCGTTKKSVTCSSTTTAEDLKCTSTVKLDRSGGNKKCGKNNAGTLWNMGFKIGAQESLQLYQICFNMETCSVLYTSHQLWGYTIPLQVSKFGATMMPFACKGLTFGNFYRDTNRQTGIKSVKENPGKFYKRALMVPDQDFPVKTWRIPLNTYANGAPGWESIVSAPTGNWFQVQEKIKTLANFTGKIYDVHTGVFYRSEGQKEFLNAKEKAIEIPQWFWKVLIQDKSSIVFY